MNTDINKCISEHSFEKETKLSEIQTFYRGSTVFLTGATGFIGHLILEKLLRTCSDVKKVYILIREKRGKTTEERFNDIFDNELFDVLKQERPNFLEKISPITGDCSLPNLGIEKRFLEILKNEINITIHSAATIKFNEPLRIATAINVCAVQNLLKLCKKMISLKSYVHISTAYSNCTTDRKIMDELFYKPNLTGDELNEFISEHDDKEISDLTPGLLRKCPNTYSMTKSVAEYELLIKGEGLPIGIIRPSIVVGTEHEPIPGWINNTAGPMGINAAVSIGLIRCMRVDVRNVADVIPGDYVSNAVIACAWDIHNKWKENKNCFENTKNEDDATVDKAFTPPIYNIVSSKKNPLTGERFTTLTKQQEQYVTSVKAIYLSIWILCASKAKFEILWFLLHTLPGFIIDGLAKLFNKKSPKLVDKFQKFHKIISELAYFTMNSWTFHDDNTTSLINRLSKQDKVLFEFDAAKIDWNSYMKKYMIGIRTYIIKDPIETLPEGLKHRQKLLRTHYSLLTALFAVLVFVLYSFVLVFINVKKFLPHLQSNL